MRSPRFCILLALLITLVVSQRSAAQDQTVGLFVNDDRAYQGYTLLAPHQHASTYLINMEGQMVNKWEHEFIVGSNTLLLENGNLLRASRAPNGWSQGGGRGGRIQELTWDGDVVWQFDHFADTYTLHHDIKKMPNGNVLATVWEVKTVNDLLEVGYDTTALVDDVFWSEVIVELRPILPDSAEIVWQWKTWDHIIQDFDDTKAHYGVVGDYPERIDINTADGESWLHFNAIDYNEDLNLIIISASRFSELWVIDHSTTTEEARGRIGGEMGFGGDLLYRWGNPEKYKKGGPEDRRLFFNHSTQWIPADRPGGGNVTIFDNGRDRTDQQYSTVYELALPLIQDYDGNYYFSMGTDGRYEDPEVVWQYSDPGVFYSNFISGQQRQPNGNTLIDEGMQGRIFEVTPEKDIVWEYISPVVRAGPLAQGEAIPPFSPGNERQQNTLFRAYRYGVDYPGLTGKDLSPKGLIELERTANETDADVPVEFALGSAYPNPFNPATTLPFRVPRQGHIRLTVYNALGQLVATPAEGPYAPGTHIVRFDARPLPSGVYFYRLEADGFLATRKMLLVK